MLAKLFSRPDMEATHLDAFFKWANDRVNDNSSSVFLVTGQ